MEVPQVGSLPDGPTYIPVLVTPSSSRLPHELLSDPICKKEKPLLHHLKFTKGCAILVCAGFTG